MLGPHRSVRNFVLAGLSLAAGFFVPAMAHGATFPVTNTNDSGAGSLRAAVVAANSAAGADVVDARGISGTISLITNLEITSAITLLGPGADVLNVESPLDREAVHILSPADAVVISGLSFLKDSGPLVVTLRGSVYKATAGSARFDACVFSASRTQFSGGAVLNDAGNLTLERCSFIGNTAEGSGGAVAMAGGLLTVRNCTFDGNQATGSGGAIHVEQGSLDLVCGTLAGNSSAAGGGVTIRSAQAQFTGALVALNSAPSGDDVLVDASAGAASLVSLGHNLIGTPIVSAGGASVTTLPSDQIGAPGSPIDPLLGALQFNGGTMATRALLPGSPALDAGDCAGLATDQRGVPRPQHAVCDIGAIEMRFPVADAGAAVSTCAGSPVPLGGAPTGSGGETGFFGYSWSPATGLDDPSAANPTATPLAPTTYTVTVTDLGSGLSSQDAVEITLLPASYTIDASAGAGGSISPSGAVAVDCGTDRTFDILPGPCHTIADVRVDGVSVGAVAQHTFTNVRANHTIAASFTLNTYNIVASAGPGGSISPSGNVVVDCGADQSFLVSPSPNHHVADVLVDGVSVGAPTAYEFTNVQAAHTIAASFAIDTYTLTVNTVGNGAVARDPDLPAYGHGTQVQLTATATVGWSFRDWSGDASGSANPIVVTMDANRTITATFTLDGYALTLLPDGKGTVARNPDLATYDPGASVELTATAAPNWRFVEWYGDATGSTNPLTLLMDADKTVFARFLPNTPPVAVAVGLPLSGATPLLVEFSAAPSTDADGDSLTFHWTFGNGATGTGRLVSHTYQLPGSFPVLLTVDDGHGGTDTASVAVWVARSFPQTAVLDNFNRADGDVGDLWMDDTQAFSIEANTLACENGIGYIEWSGTTFGPDQEVFVTLATLTPAAEHNLMLKTQGSSWDSGHIEVSYNPAASRVRVYTLTPPETWTLRGTILGVTLAAGDQYGARALADGSVQVFRNGQQVGSVSVAGWPYASQGGRIGVSYDNSPATRFDDFGGGDFTEPPTSPLVISQIYGGGGSAGSTYTHDYIELFNRGNRPVNVTGWSVQHAAANASSWSVTALSGTIPPGGYYLVQENAGNGGSVPLPTPDAVGTIAMGPSSGKVALVRGTAALTGTCPGDAWIVDLVGFGAASCAEGVPVAAADNLSAVLRNGGGCEDTGYNASDLTIGTPAPRNSASPRQQCAVWLAADGVRRPELELSAPAPNPFRDRLRLHFGLPRAANVHVRVLDLQGRLVATLAEGGFGPGRHDVTWDGATGRGPAGAGIYFIRMDALGQHLVRKVAVTR